MFCFDEFPANKCSLNGMTMMHLFQDTFIGKTDHPMMLASVAHQRSADSAISHRKFFKTIIAYTIYILCIIKIVFKELLYFHYYFIVVLLLSFQTFAIMASHWLCIVQNYFKLNILFWRLPGGGIRKNKKIISLSLKEIVKQKFNFIFYATLFIIVIIILLFCSFLLLAPLFV